MGPLVLAEMWETLIVICKVQEEIYSQCGRPHRKQSWMWNLFCAYWWDQTVGPLATTQGSVKIWIMNIPLLRESSGAKMANLWVPSFISCVLAMGWKQLSSGFHHMGWWCCGPYKWIPFFLDWRPCKWQRRPGKGWSVLHAWTWARRFQKTWELVARDSTVKESSDGTSGISWMVFGVAARAICWGGHHSNSADFLAIALIDFNENCRWGRYCF